jgi:hypothetical protein
MSSARQTVIRGPSFFAGFGNLPVFTPAHQVDFETGIGPSGARIDDNRTKPASGNELERIISYLHQVNDGDGLPAGLSAVAELGFA